MSTSVVRILTLIEMAEVALLKIDLAISNNELDIPPRWKKRLHEHALLTRRLQLDAFELRDLPKPKRKVRP